MSVIKYCSTSVKVIGGVFVSHSKKHFVSYFGFFGELCNALLENRHEIRDFSTFPLHIDDNNIVIFNLQGKI